MRRFLFFPLIIFSFIMGLMPVTLWAGPALAQSHHENLQIKNIWARATPPGVMTGVAYFTIMNIGTVADRLVGVESTIAKKAQMHTHLMADNIMRMRHVKKIDVMPNMPLTLRPGGYHIMLIGLKKSLSPGEHFPLTLIFENAGKIKVVAKVHKKIKKPDSSPGMNHGLEHGHN